jgi:hypothetical protein
MTYVGSSSLIYWREYVYVINLYCLLRSFLHGKSVRQLSSLNGSKSHVMHGTLSHSWELSHDFKWITGTSHESWEPPMNHGSLPWFMGSARNSWDTRIIQGEFPYLKLPWFTGVSHYSWEVPMIHGRLPWIVGASRQSWGMRNHGSPPMNYSWELVSVER